MSMIERAANDLYHYNGGDTANALSQSHWNDAVGRSIKDRIVHIVDSTMREARHYYAHELSNIKTEEIENALQLAWMHIRG